MAIQGYNPRANMPGQSSPLDNQPKQPGFFSKLASGAGKLLMADPVTGTIARDPILQSVFGGKRVPAAQPQAAAQVQPGQGGNAELLAALKGLKPKEDDPYTARMKVKAEEDAAQGKLKSDLIQSTLSPTRTLE